MLSNYNLRTVISLKWQLIGFHFLMDFYEILEFFIIFYFFMPINPNKKNVENFFKH